MTANSSSNCIIGERNLCTPNGKIAALMIDMDGTTVVCQPYFDEAAEEFATFMSFIGVTKDVARETLRKVYGGSMPHRGFERERFPEALMETYELLAGNHAVSVPPEDIENVRSILKGIGSAPYFRKPKLFPHCMEVLNRAHDRFMLIAVTVGDHEVQEYKIRQAGLDKMFDYRIITLQEAKDELVEEAMHDLNIDPHYSAFIGNSVRSDGICLKKTNLIYLPLEASLPKATDKFPENTGFTQFNVNNWREAEQRAINRLIRQRDQAIRSLPAGADCAPCKTKRGGRGNQIK
jgi:beta-phosphoglucomutase-like phosphatase (HAD superfamily)